MTDWLRARLADIADIRFSNVDKKTGGGGEKPVLLCNYMDVYGNGGYITADLPFMEASASQPEIDRFAVAKGDVILTKDSETPDDIGVPAVVIDEIPNLVCGYHLALVKPNRERLDPIYLAKQLGSSAAASYFSKRASGSTRYGLSSSALAAVPVPMAPIDQQRRIAEILATLDETIEQTELLIAKYQQIKAGLMHDLFTRGVTPDGRLRPSRNEAPQLYKESPLGWIPIEWKPGRLSDCLNRNEGIKPGPFGASVTKDTYTTSGFRVYGQEQVIAGRLDVGDYYISSQKFLELRAFEVLANDVLVSLVGTVGCVLVVEPPFEPGIINPRLMRLRPAEGLVIPRYLKYFLLSSAIKKQLDALAGGGTMPVINGKVIRRLEAPMVGIDEQRLIVDRLYSVDKYIGSLQEEANKLRLVKNGLMHDLLSGRVRVKIAEVVAA